MNIFIAKLSPETTEDDLREVFAEYGAVTSAKVIMDRESGNSKCFGFVEMADDNEANQAIEELNEATLNGNQIVVKKARPKEERSDRGGGSRRFGGGGNSGGYGGGQKRFSRPRNDRGEGGDYNRGSRY
jgi:RNA recognition motif-containing protein